MKTLFNKLLTLCLFIMIAVSFSCSSDDDGGSAAGEVTFSKADGADWTLAENQDRITDDVWITRQDNGFIFNIAVEDSFSGGCNSSLPSGTEWALGTYSDGIDDLNFASLLEINDCEPPTMLDQDLVLHLIADNIYYDVTFTSWSIGENGGEGGFSYKRIRRN